MAVTKKAKKMSMHLICLKGIPYSVQFLNRIVIYRIKFVIVLIRY